MVEDTKENFTKIYDVDKAFVHGLMEESMKDNGKTVNKMVKV